ncbi:hypothetical protein ABPG72_008258 [Tetrahymena utriculariae]
MVKLLFLQYLLLSVYYNCYSGCKSDKFKKNQKQEEKSNQKKIKLLQEQQDQALSLKLQEIKLQTQEQLDQAMKEATHQFEEQYEVVNQNDQNIENSNDQEEENLGFIKRSQSSIARIDSHSKDFKSNDQLIDNNQEFSVEIVNKSQEKSQDNMSLEVPNKIKTFQKKMRLNPYPQITKRQELIRKERNI